MAASVQQPKPVGALSLLAGVAPIEEDPRYSQLVDSAINSMTPSSDQRWKDEQLAFAGGRDERGGGDFAGALSAGFRAQSEQRNKTKELSAQYLPTILNALTAQQAMKQQQALMQQLMGPNGGQWLSGISEKYGIAPEAILADFATNNGKGIREMIYKNSTPEMVPNDGFLIDKNPYTSGARAAAGPQRLPSMRSGAGGETTVNLPDSSDPSGFRTHVPGGATAAVKGFKSAAERAVAEQDPQVIRPAGEPPQQTTRAGVVDMVNSRSPGKRQVDSGVGPGLPPVANPEQFKGSFRLGRDGKVDVQAAMSAVNGMTDPQEKAQAWVALQNQIRAEDGGPGSEAQAEYQAAVDAGDTTRIAAAKARLDRERQAAPTVGVPIMSPAEEAREAEATKTEQTQTADNQKQLRNAKTSVKQLQSAISLLEGKGKNKPTSSGLGKLVDEGAAFFGGEAAGYAEAEELRNIQGWLTSKVPRMEGPQSNFDVQNYQQMTGMVGNERLPLNVRIQAAKRAMQMIEENAPKNFGSDSWKSAQPDEVVNSPRGKREASGKASGPMPTIKELVEAEKKRRAGGG